mgnify:FL=1
MRCKTRSIRHPGTVTAYQSTFWHTRPGNRRRKTSAMAYRQVSEARTAAVSPQPISNKASSSCSSHPMRSV